MSIAPREAKWNSHSIACDGTAALVRAAPVGLALPAHERRAARGAGRRELPAARRASALRQDRPDDLGDHVAGAADDRRCRPRARPCARPRPRCAASPSPTVTPPTNTGSSTANGVTMPVRPVCTSMCREERRALLGRELVRDGPPRRVRRGRRAPPAGRSSRPSRRRRRSRSRSCGGRARQRSQYANTSSRRPTTSVAGFTGSPASAQVRERLECAPNRVPSANSTPWHHSASGRDAVTSGSFWRSDPAAAFRGFANVRCLGFEQLARSALEPLDREGTPRRERRAPRGRSEPRSRTGTCRIVRMFAVTSSPVCPSPRVAPPVNTPCS